MKKILLIALLLSLGFSQKLTEVVETYNNGNIKSITYHKETRTRIEKVKYREYYENGQKSVEVTLKNGKRDGLYTEWYENGQKMDEKTYKDGKGDGLWTGWYENGKKWYQGTFKDDEFFGLWNNWYDNGQKLNERTFKDGELISEQCWDEDGNEIDCN